MTVRIAVVGCGAIAHWHLDAIERGGVPVEVTAAIDPVEANARRVADRTIDVLFHEFMADDVAMVEQIYARNDRALTPEARAQLDAFMAANPRGKHGRLVYDLRGDFGLDPDDVRSRFGYYFDRFPIRAEVS